MGNLQNTHTHTHLCYYPCKDLTLTNYKLQLNLFIIFIVINRRHFFSWSCCKGFAFQDIKIYQNNIVKGNVEEVMHYVLKHTCIVILTLLGTPESLIIQAVILTDNPVAMVVGAA